MIPGHAVLNNSHHVISDHTRRCLYGRFARAVIIFSASFFCAISFACAAEGPNETCPRPAPGVAVPEPEDLRSQNGTLEVSLTVRNSTEKDGSVRYCYLLPDGSQSPTLRLHRGDLLILHLKTTLLQRKIIPRLPHPEPPRTLTQAKLRRLTHAPAWPSR